MKKITAAALQVAGCSSIAVGFGLLQVWAGVVVGGVLAVGLGVVLEREGD